MVEALLCYGHFIFLVRVQGIIKSTRRFEHLVDSATKLKNVWISSPKNVHICERL